MSLQYLDFHIHLVRYQGCSGEKAAILSNWCINFQSLACINLHPLLTRGSVVARLLSEKPGIATYDLDSRFGVRRAYCTAGPQRISFMTDQIEGADLGKEPITERWFSVDKEFASFVSSSGKSNMETLSLPGMEPTFTCKRNEEWIDSILRHLDGKIHFVAVGAAHMFDIERPGLKCPGLLTLLAAKGLKPVLIPSAQ